MECNVIYAIIYDIIWYDMIWYDMICYYMIWYDMIWYDIIWYIKYYIYSTSKYKILINIIQNKVK